MFCFSPESVISFEILIILSSLEYIEIGLFLVSFKQLDYPTFLCAVFIFVVFYKSLSWLIAFSYSSNLCFKVRLPRNLFLCRYSGNSGLGKDPDRVVYLRSRRVPVLCGAQPVDSDVRLGLPGALSWTVPLRAEP